MRMLPARSVKLTTMNREGVYGLSEGVLSSIGEELQQREHDGLVIRDGHIDGAPLFSVSWANFGIGGPAKAALTWGQRYRM
jgi:hypothetical protein